MAFIPISADDLKVGLYIRLDHGWNEHPFLRNSFTIQSLKDIAIIRKQKLTKISYDPDRTNLTTLETVPSPVQSGTGVDPEKKDSFSEQELEQIVVSLKEEKEQLIQNLFTHQDTIKETEKAYQAAIYENRTVLKMLSTGQSEGLDLAKEIVGSIMGLLQCPSPTLTIVNTPPPKNITEEVSVHSMNVCSLALLLGETLGLNQEDMQTLGQGALFYNIGLHRVPSAVRAKRKDALSVKERQLLEAYPYFGRQMVENISGVTPNCLNIISQHREKLDGSGYPQGLKGDQIGFLPQVVGVVTEYFSLLNDGQRSESLSPTQALTYLYTKMKDKCDPDIIDAFIATVTVYPPGTFVRLTDEYVGLVVKTNKSERLRPLVVVYETIQESADLVIIDLAKERELVIEETLNPKNLDPKILSHLQQSLGGIKGYFVST